MLDISPHSQGVTARAQCNAHAAWVHRSSDGAADSCVDEDASRGSHAHMHNAGAGNAAGLEGDLGWGIAVLSCAASAHEDSKFVKPTALNADAAVANVSVGVRALGQPRGLLALIKRTHMQPSVPHQLAQPTNARSQTTWARGHGAAHQAPQPSRLASAAASDASPRQARLARHCRDGT